MVTKDELWAKINEDPEMQQQPEAIRQALRPYIEAALTVLADLLDKPATLSNIAQAKVKFLRYCVDNGFVKNVVSAVPDEAFLLFSRKDISDMLEEVLSRLTEMAEALTGDMTVLFKKHGMTEYQLILSAEMGLNAGARKLYEAGQLTIEKLLLVQPTIILKNTE